MGYQGSKLQTARKTAGMTQAQLSTRTGIKLQVLQQYERGARDISRALLPTLLKLCNTLNCRLTDIVTDDETLDLLKIYER